MNESSLNKEQLDFSRYFLEFKKRWGIVAIIIAACLVVTYFATNYAATPMYTSCAKIYVVNSQMDKISANEIAISTYLTKDYQELISDRSVLEEVDEMLGLGYGYDRMKSCVRVENTEETRILELYATTPDAETSQDIASAICSVAQKKLVDIMGVDRVTIMSEANLPTTPTSPNMLKNLLVALVVALLISGGTIFVFYYRDDSIFSEEDVELFLEIPVLGTIPYSNAKDNRGVGR